MCSGLAQPGVTKGRLSLWFHNWPSPSDCGLSPKAALLPFPAVGAGCFAASSTSTQCFQLTLICICSSKGLTQQLSGGDKALYKLRIININISHGFVEFCRDANKHQTSHKKRRLFLLILGRSVVASGIDMVSQDSFVFVCVLLRSEILHHWGKCRLWSEWLKSEPRVYLNQLIHRNCQF